MFKMFCRFQADQSGATAIEYGLLCALIGLVMIAAAHMTGQQLVTSLFGLVTALQSLL